MFNIYTYYEYIEKNNIDIKNVYNLINKNDNIYNIDDGIDDIAVNYNKVYDKNIEDFINLLLS